MPVAVPAFRKVARSNVSKNSASFLKIFFKIKSYNISVES